MPTTHLYAPILGRRMRATQLKDDGSIGLNKLVTDGYITTTLSATIEDGTEIVQRNAAGQLCVNELGNPSFKRFTVETEFCGVNPSLLSFVSNAKEYEDYANDIAGFTVPEGEITGLYALELWTGLSGSLADTAAGGYMLLPQIHKGNLGDITIDGENAVTFTVTGSYTVGGNQWGVGPAGYKVLANATGVPSQLPTALDPLDHFLLIDTAVAAPPSSGQPELVSAA
jgi:hypothetical protein